MRSGVRHRRARGEAITIDKSSRPRTPAHFARARVRGFLASLVGVLLLGVAPTAGVRAQLEAPGDPTLAPESGVASALAPPIDGAGAAAAAAPSPPSAAPDPAPASAAPASELAAPEREDPAPSAASLVGGIDVASSLERDLDDIQGLVEEAHYRTALSVANATRPLLPELGPDRARLEVLCATALVALDRGSRAQEHMRAALAAWPELELDPGTTSPRVVAVLARVRDDGTGVTP